eukprot:1850848-Alexandrium_andersonii.AAC.1
MLAWAHANTHTDSTPTVDSKRRGGATAADCAHAVIDRRSGPIKLERTNSTSNRCSNNPTAL